MNALREHRDKLIENIENLEYIHSDLTLERDALLYDEAEIELRARTFGYYRDNEVQVLLPNHRERASSRTLGTLIRHIPVPPGNGIAFRVIFLCIFATVLAGTFVWKRHGNNSREE